MHYHIENTDRPKQERWAEAKKQYGDVMRDPDSINFITIFREPRDRLLSFYTFFIEFETLVRTQTRGTGVKAPEKSAACQRNTTKPAYAFLFVRTSSPWLFALSTE